MKNIRPRTFKTLRIYFVLVSTMTLTAGWLWAGDFPRAHSPSAANCGVLSLAYLLSQAGDIQDAESVGRMMPPSPRGYSIVQLQHIAADRGFELQGVQFNPESIAGPPLPFIVHLPKNAYQPHDGHFCILEKVDAQMVGLFDPQSGKHIQMARPAFEKHWNGVALMAKETVPADARLLSIDRAQRVFGGTDQQASTPSGSGDYGLPGSGLGSGSGSGSGGGSGGSNPCGTPIWDVNMVNLNLAIRDIPLWYSPPIGPQVQIALTYNSQYPVTGNEAMGRKWVLNYQSFLFENAEEGSVTVVLPDGKHEIYKGDGDGGYVGEYKVFNKLEKIAEDHFQVTLPDDTVFVYQIPKGSTAAFPLLVEWRNARGQALTMGYNTSAQLVSITDPVGDVSDITYTNDRITRVDDPFGRHAEFEYNADGDLTKITDMGGYWTELAYDADAYITGMANEKGTTQFYIEPSKTPRQRRSPIPHRARPCRPITASPSPIPRAADPNTTIAANPVTAGM